MIRAEGLTRQYRGARTVTALDGLTLDAARGEVVGIAGPNGAGKSTFLSLLLGFIAPTSGTLTIDGERPRPWIERHGACYLPELVNLPARWTVGGTLERLARLGSVPEGELRATVGRALATVGLADVSARQVRQLSKGMLQRLGLAQALLDRSPLVVLDEPTHGLDPVWTVRFREIVAELRSPERAVFVASHNLDELERVADRVVILAQGRLQTIADIRARPAADVTRAVTYRVELAAPHDALLAALPGAAAVEGAANTFRVTGDLAALNAALARLLAEGVTIVAFQPERTRLEETFRDAIGERR